jgi:hypothetical protein
MIRRVRGEGRTTKTPGKAIGDGDNGDGDDGDGGERELKDGASTTMAIGARENEIETREKSKRKRAQRLTFQDDGDET